MPTNSLNCHKRRLVAAREVRQIPDVLTGTILVESALSFSRKTSAVIELSGFLEHHSTKRHKDVRNTLRLKKKPVAVKEARLTQDVPPGIILVVSASSFIRKTLDVEEDFG